MLGKSVDALRSDLLNLLALDHKTPEAKAEAARLAKKYGAPIPMLLQRAGLR